MRNVFTGLVFGLLSAVAFAGVTAEKLGASNSGKNTLEIMCATFADTEVEALSGAADDISAYLAEKKVSVEQKATIGRIVRGMVDKRITGEEKAYRLAEVDRCFYGKPNQVSLTKAEVAEPVVKEEVAAAPTPIIGESHRVDSGRVRLMVGGVYENGLEASGTRGKADDGTFGVSFDAMENFVESDYWNLWFGLGFSYNPKQDLGGASVGSTTELGTVLQDKCDYEASMLEFRLKLNPELRVTDYWTIGVLAAIALDRVDLNAKERFTATNAAYPILNNSRSASTSEDKTFVSGIFGLQTTYRVTEHFGVYANAFYRTEHDFEFASELTPGSHKMEVGGCSFGAGLFSEF